MLRLCAHRIALSLPLVFIVSVLAFVVLAFSPGNIAYNILGPDAPASAYAHIRAQLGLDHPLYIQYWQWLSRAIHGNFGRSYVTGQSVEAAVLQRLPVTLALVTGALVVSTLAGIGLGVLAAIRRGKSARIVDAISLFGVAVPEYWLALAAIAIFAVEWRLLPATGYVSLADSFSGWVRSMILPVAALSIGGVARLAKQTRDGMLDALGSDYVIALRARGVRERSIIFKHALRNSSIPVVTIVGLHAVYMLSGTVFVETIFGLPGLGSLVVQGTLNHDIPIVQGTAVFFAFIVVVVNLCVDLLYGGLNPKARIR